MGHRQKQKFSTVVTELKKSQEGLEKKFKLLGNAVITADSANKEDKKYFRGIAIATNEMLGEMDGHKTKIEEWKWCRKECFASRLPAMAGTESVYPAGLPEILA